VQEEHDGSDSAVFCVLVSTLYDRIKLQRPDIEWVPTDKQGVIRGSTLDKPGVLSGTWTPPDDKRRVFIKIQVRAQT
jgi:hypothetical protein